MFDVTTLVLCLIFLYLDIPEVQLTSPPYLDNVICDSYEGIVSVDSPLFRYNPYYIKLQRCQGADANPINGRVCLPTKEQKMSISVTKEDGTGYKVITVSNQTECDFLCKNNKSLCSKYQQWNDDTCRCDCTQDPPDCGENKQWEGFLCTCIPKERSARGCGSVLAIKYVVTIMFVELFIVAAICALIFHRIFYTSDAAKPEEVRLNTISDKEEITA